MIRKNPGETTQPIQKKNQTAYFLIEEKWLLLNGLFPPRQSVLKHLDRKLNE